MAQSALIPWWRDVRDVADSLGGVTGIGQSDQVPTAKLDWFISHISGNVASYAALCRMTELQEVLDQMQEAVRCYWDQRDWDGRLLQEFVRRGIVPRKDGAA